MPQKTHIMHGRDHEPHGADPIRWWGAVGSYTERVLAEPSLVGYWPLSDASAPALDVSPNDYHLDEENEAPEYRVEDDGEPGGPLPASIYPYAVRFDGTHGSSDPVESLAYYDPGVEPKPFTFTPAEPFTLEVYAYWEADVGSMISLGADPVILSLFAGTDQIVSFLSVESTGISLNPETWVHVAATYDGDSTAKIYFDGALVGSGAAFSWATIGNRVEVGGHLTASIPLNWNGRLAHAAVYNTALTQTQIASHVSGGAGTVPPGWVLVPDPDNPDGPPVWAPPGTEIEHGDGDPDENPVTGPPPGIWTGSPESASGWHYLAHYEYAVLYDSSPARFDVPPRQWTRVPFNTVRIQRTWELTVDGNYKTAWLADDRGLTENARNGTLLITPGMTFESQTITGWFTIEYPVLNYLGLPDYTGGVVVAPDRYTRAARMISTTSGQVLRWQVEPNMRAFFEWPFYDDADGDALASYWTVDNPFPIYPHWAARPLNKPLPYPKLSNAASLDYYTYNISNNPGFMLDALEVEANLPAGHAIALQAWQDTPYLLRFGTDKYPPYTPYNYTEEWRKRPCLVIGYGYDPETIDHTTGAVL